MSRKNSLASKLYIIVLPSINTPKEQTFKENSTFALLTYRV